MNWKAFHFPATIASLLVSAGLIAAQFFWHIDIVEFPFDFLAHFEQSELDEIVTLFGVTGIVFLAEQRIQRRRAAAKIEEARVQGIHRTMLDVQQIVSDFITQVKMLRAEARKDSKLEALMFEQAVTDTLAKLTAIGGLRNYLETQLARDAGLGI
jgi:hypothetical protein